MNRATAIALMGAQLLITSTAAAQPVEHPEVEPCRVTIALAPPDVRAEIEAWVNAEPRCVRELEVRAIPTDGGLYLSARDNNGRTRERVVPDAQSAAVLIVSWMADDSLGASPPVATAEVPASHATIGPTSVVDLTADTESPFEMHAHTRQRAGSHRYLTLGAIGHDADHAGVRAQVDLFGGRYLSLGLAGGWSQHGGQARVVAGATKSFGRFAVRAQIGIGADFATVDASTDPRQQMQVVGPQFDARDSMMEATASRVQPRGEVGLLGRIAIDRNWAVLGGPVVEAGTSGPIVIEGFIGVQHPL